MQGGPENYVHLDVDMLIFPDILIRFYEHGKFYSTFIIGIYCASLYRLNWCQFSLPYLFTEVTRETKNNESILVLQIFIRFPFLSSYDDISYLQNEKQIVHKNITK